MIDDEVKMIVSDAHNEARRILLEKREVLETVTRRLLDKEVMEGDELRAILEGTHISDHSAEATATPATQSTA
jgi:cell division protease FtsH